MDVHCSTCNEPWDTHHLRYEAVFDTGLRLEEAEVWRSLPNAERMSELYRAEFRAAGWVFGQTVVNVLHCPCCPAGARPDEERLKTKAALESLMGGDEDGLAATFEEFQL